jgi:hypothetical protein
VLVVQVEGSHDWRVLPVMPMMGHVVSSPWKVAGMSLKLWWARVVMEAGNP